MTFDTRDSGPVTFMKSVQVSSNWEGFTMKYEYPLTSSGMAHVFYLGIDPVSQSPDTILISSFVLEETEGYEVINYKIQQDITSPTIVIRVEDFRGYMVDEKSWAEVENLVMEKIDPQHFSFYCDNSVEDDEDMLGLQYLFDGDTKGVVSCKLEKYCSFLAGPDAAGEDAHPMYIDLKENRIVASVRLYNLLYNFVIDGWYPFVSSKSSIVNYYNENELPCDVTIYGLKDDGANPATYGDMHSMGNWEEIGRFKQSRFTIPQSRWCPTAWGTYELLDRISSLEEMEAAKEEFMDIMVPAEGQEEGYRYLKMVINDVFELYDNSYADKRNTYNYVQFHELEVYTKKDE